MRRSLFIPSLLVSILLATPPLEAQDAPTATPTDGPAPAMQAFVDEVEVVRDKLMGLADAIPTEDWDWRPGEGVRSVNEVFLHVAADNYLLPTAAGIEAPPETGIEGDDFATVRAFQDQDASPEETREMLDASFAHLIEAMESVEPSDLEGDVSILGQRFTTLGLWTRTTTHVHEHLGQMIAYARTNGVVPPWSR